MIWEKVKIEMDVWNKNGELVHLKDVPALRNPKTGTVGVHPQDVVTVLGEELSDDEIHEYLSQLKKSFRKSKLISVKILPKSKKKLEALKQYKEYFYEVVERVLKKLEMYEGRE